MQSTKIAYLFVLTTLIGCSNHNKAVPLASVPATPTAMQTDLEATSDSLQEARVTALRQRMQALKDDARHQDPVPVAEDMAHHITAETLGNFAPASAPQAAVSGAAPAPQTLDDMDELPASDHGSEPAFNPRPAEPVMGTPLAPAPQASAAPLAITQPLAPIILRQPHALRAGTQEVMEVLFAHNSSRLTPADRKKVLAATQAMLPQGDHYLIEGYASPLRHTTPKGELLNLRLSVNRAQAVHDLLVEAGFAPEQLTLRGLSARNPRGFAEIKRRAVVWSRVAAPAPLNNNTVLWPQ